MSKGSISKVSKRVLFILGDKESVYVRYGRVVLQTGVSV